MVREGEREGKRERERREESVEWCEKRMKIEMGMKTRSEMSVHVPRLQCSSCLRVVSDSGKERPENA